MLVFKIMDIVFIAAFFILLCETAIRLILIQNKPTIEERGKGLIVRLCVLLVLLLDIIVFTVLYLFVDI